MQVKLASRLGHVYMSHDSETIFEILKKKRGRRKEIIIIVIYKQFLANVKIVEKSFEASFR